MSPIFVFFISLCLSSSLSSCIVSISSSACVCVTDTVTGFVFLNARLCACAPICLSMYMPFFLFAGLSACLSVGTFVCPFVSLVFCQPVRLLVYLFVLVSACLSVCLSVFLCLSVCLFVLVSTCLSVCLSVCFSVCLRAEKGGSRAMDVDKREWSGSRIWERKTSEKKENKSEQKREST